MRESEARFCRLLEVFPGLEQPLGGTLGPEVPPFEECFVGLRRSAAAREARLLRWRKREFDSAGDPASDGQLYRKNIR